MAEKEHAVEETTQTNGSAPAVEENKVFVGNLPFRTTQDALTKFFESAGKVTDATIIKHGRRSLGYGFVAFETAEAAEKAKKELNKKEFEGREVNVEVAKPKTTREARKRQEQKEGSSDESEKPKARKPRRRNNRRKTRRQKKASEANKEQQQEKKDESEKTETKAAAEEEKQQQQQQPAAAVSSTEQSEAAAAAAQKPSKRQRSKKGKAPRRPRRRPARIDDEAAEPSKTTLFVANLPYSTTDEAFLELFKEYKVKSGQVARIRNGRSKGYGFVEMETEEEQKRALENIKDVELEGRAIYLKVALSQRSVKTGSESEEGKTDESNAEEKKADENKSDEKKADEKKPEEKKVEDKKPVEKKAEDKKTSISKPEDKKPAPEDKKEVEKSKK
ncbi:hypothetical protein VTP01DRAFT_10044 [Rhizomucor pusillus]|uniref:uncharacterized protein n=1 Tax=Rhizomucor pusillus TaxID=4840 RepID=UPI0037447584